MKERKISVLKISDQGKTIPIHDWPCFREGAVKCSGVSDLEAEGQFFFYRHSWVLVNELVWFKEQI